MRGLVDKKAGGLADARHIIEFWKISIVYLIILKRSTNVDTDNLEEKKPWIKKCCGRLEGWAGCENCHKTHHITCLQRM